MKNTLIGGMLFLVETMRKRTKRKHWNLIDVVQHAIVGASITHREKLDKLRMMEYSALEAIIKGRGTIHDWRTLVDVLNLSETMGRAGVGPEVLPICEKAQASLHKASGYYQTTMRVILDAEGIQACRDLISYADLQQSSIPRSEFERYIQKTKDYIRSHGKQVVEIE
jgi:hypothetical protein